MGEIFQVLVKKYRGMRYKKWSIDMGQFPPPPAKHSPTPELYALMREQAVAVRPKRNIKDLRACSFCGLFGDQEPDGPGRCVKVMMYTVHVHANIAFELDLHKITYIVY